MPCDGKNPNCDRRRELLARLKCVISSMERKKPCEWDEPSAPPKVYCPAESRAPSCDSALKTNFFELRASIMHKCECIRRNGLQDSCLMWDFMGRPECMTKLYPICKPGHAALLNLTDLGDVNIALKKFYCADQAREAALALYCRLVSDKNQQRQIPSCNKNNNVEFLPPSAMSTDARCMHHGRDNSDNEMLRFSNCMSPSHLGGVSSPPPHVHQGCVCCTS